MTGGVPWSSPDADPLADLAAAARPAPFRPFMPVLPGAYVEAYRDQPWFPASGTYVVPEWAGIVADAAVTGGPVPPVPSGEDFAANIRRAVDQVTRSNLLVNPADEDRVRAAALERGLILGVLGQIRVSSYAPEGKVFVVTRPTPPDTVRGLTS